MTQYARARTNAEIRRLLGHYQRRLHSNLRPFSTQPEVDAEPLAALIDGHYLRAALSDSGTATRAAYSTLDTLDLILKART